MKRYLITNPRYSGAAEIVYNQHGLLQKIDVSNTSMDEFVLGFFKKSVPVQLANITEAFGPATTIVESDVEVTFEMFWVAYRKKINRLRSESLWKKISKTEQVQAYYAIAIYDKYLQKNDWRNKADPDTFLRNKYYQNEYK